MNLYDYSEHNLFLIGNINGDFKKLSNKIINHLSITQKEEQNASFNDFIIQKLKEENDYEPREYTIQNVWLGLRDGFNSFEHPINNKYDKAIFIVCGDCGIGYKKLEYYLNNFQKFNEILSLNDSVLLLMRGSHDDPLYFSNHLINLSNIKTIDDYSIVKTKSGNVLCVGGGISLDRVWRIKQEQRLNNFIKTSINQLYWENEEPIFDEEKLNDLKNNAININIVVTHTTPSFIKPIIKEKNYWIKDDKKLAKDIKKSIKTIDKLYHYIQESKNNELRFIAFSDRINASLQECNGLLTKPLEQFEICNVGRVIENHEYKKSQMSKYTSSFADFLSKIKDITIKT